MFGVPTSGFWFYGRLHPADQVLPFNVQEVPVENGVALEITWDGIAAWSRPGTLSMKEPGEASQLFRLVVGAYALLTCRSLDWSLDGWVEAKEATFSSTVVGFRLARGNAELTMADDATDNVTMRRAAELAVAVRRKPSYRLALRDVHAATREDGEDAFVFAYRAVEDVARAVSGAGDLRARDWAKLHRTLRTSRDAFMDRLEALKTARDLVVHGNEQDERLARMRLKRDEIVNVGRMVVAETMDADHDLPFRLPDSAT